MALLHKSLEFLVSGGNYHRRRRVVRVAPEVLLGILSPGTIITKDGKDNEVVWSPHQPLPASTPLSVVAASYDETSGSFVLLVESPNFDETPVSDPWPSPHASAEIVCRESPSLRSKVEALLQDVTKKELHSDAAEDDDIDVGKRSVIDRLAAILGE